MTTKELRLEVLRLEYSGTSQQLTSNDRRLTEPATKDPKHRTLFYLARDERTIKPPDINRHIKLARKDLTTQEVNWFHIDNQISPCLLTQPPRRLSVNHRRGVVGQR